MTYITVKYFISKELKKKCYILELYNLHILHHQILPLTGFHLKNDNESILLT